jgi:hypothetical protein
LIVLSHHLADGIMYALQSLAVAAYAVTLDVIDDIQCGELRRFIVGIIIDMIVYDGIIIFMIVYEVSLNFLIFKLCLLRAIVVYRS